MSTQSNAERLQALFDAFNRHDIDAVMSFFADDVVFDGAAGSEVHGTRFQGREAVASAFQGVWTSMPDVQWRNTRHQAFGDFGVSEWTFTATRSDGQRIEANGVDLFRFRDGKIISKNAFRKDRPLLAPQAR